MQEKLEDHDVFHVLTNTRISVLEEIGMQFYLLGNGKKSIYLFMVTFSGILFYPTKFNYFIEQYLRGKNAHAFHYINFEKLLPTKIETIRKTFNIK